MSETKLKFHPIPPGSITEVYMQLDRLRDHVVTYQIRKISDWTEGMKDPYRRHPTEKDSP